MSFKDQLDEDLDVFFNTDEFAETVTYTPVEDGASKDIPALVDFDENPEDMGRASAAAAGSRSRPRTFPPPATGTRSSGTASPSPSSGC